MTKNDDDRFLDAIIENRFYIHGKLGRGGMSSVYSAKHKQVDMTVAVKILHTHFSSEEEGIERFRREAGIVNRLNHPNVVHTLSFGILSGPLLKLDREGKVYEDGVLDSPRPYLVLEYLEGKGLDQILEERGRLDGVAAKRIIIGVCYALKAAHEEHVVHRDIKPSNIMIVSSKESLEDVDSIPHVKVLDFGISKMMVNVTDQQTLTQPGYNFGSPLYMSPEQCTGSELDSRSDIYSLGCMYYELLAGRPPLEGKNPLHTFAMHIYEQPRSVNQHIHSGEKVSPEVEAIINKCMAKEKEERYASIDELLADLTR